MTSTERLLGQALVALTLVGATSCNTDPASDGALEAPGNVRAQAIDNTSIRLTWTPPQSQDVLDFVLQRRENLEGHFATIATLRASAGSSYLDLGLQPSTFYGYRLITLDRLGNESPPSTVAGALTPPLPGIRVITGRASAIADPDGYLISLAGPSDTVSPIGVSESRLFSPLPPGAYTVTLRDVQSTCSVPGDTIRTVNVTDRGLNTLQQVQFDVSCLDPGLGQIVAIVEVAGDSLDADGYRLDFAGIIPGDTMPALGGATLTGSGGSATFPSLRPGDYEVTLTDVEAPCTVSAGSTRSAQVTALSVDTVRFAVTCPTKGGGSGPFVWRNTFTPQSAGPGQTVTLLVTADLSAIPTQDFGAAQATVTYDPAILTFISAAVPPPAPLNNLTVNTSTPGQIGYLNLATGTPPTGLVPIVQFTFQVKAGATGGATTGTRTQLQIVAAGDGATPLDTLFRIVEDTFAVGSGGGSNQLPSARANGPYTATVGSAVSFSSTGSVDPDGSITGYQWAFGDGASSGQPNPSHSYSSAGSYTALLTVTDNQGGQGTDQAAVNVSGGGGGNQSPTAAAGGPYTGIAGSPIGFSSAGSSDPDGSITGYLWDFGDGGTSGVANPSHTYSLPGDYTATLTVTDNQGATGTAQAAVTVAASTTPFTWNSSFGAFEPVLGTYPLTITLDLSQDISQTPGPEAIGSYAVDSLTWDPALLQYHSLVYASGGGSFNTTNAVGGCHCKLIFNGAPTTNAGVVTLATVRFQPTGTAGTTTTRTSLGPVLSTTGLGSFNYRPLIRVVEGSLTVP
jgi:PKD repeat protein